MATQDNRTASVDDERHLLPLVLADDLTEGLVVIDRESVIQYANPAVTRIFGYGRDELEGESLTVVMPREYREAHREALEGYLSTGERNLTWSDVELPGRHRDGHRLDLRISFSELTWRGERMFAGTIRDLTEPKDPEEEQRILARSYRALFDENVAAVFRTAPDGRILSANGALARMAGLRDADRLRGRNVRELYAEGEDRERFLRDLREHREVRNRELHLRRADGTTRWSLVNAVWIDDPADEEPAALVGTVVDISDRKRAERELQLADERYRRLFEQEVAGVYRSEMGPDGRVIECNQEFAEIFGYDSPEDVADTPAQAFYPEDEDRQQTVRAVREDGVVVKHEARLRRKDGSVAWGLAHARVVEDPEHGEILEGMIFDITPRVQARQALERAKEQFETVFEVSPVALKVIDADTADILQVNETFLEVFGYARSEMTSGKVATEDLWPDTDRWGRIEKRVRRGETVRNEEVRLQRRDRSTFDALYSGSLLQLGEDRFLVCAVQDISQLKAVERELEHRSLHDRLTGLPNRALFWDRLEHALERSQRTGEKVAVLFLDLDGFKRINDEHGHAAGDEVLRRVADRLRSGVREADTLARLGGDEFGVLLEDLDEESDAMEAARRVTHRFEPAVPVAGEEALIHVSCGVALAGGDRRGEDRITPDDLVHRADRAMYVAKEEPGSSSRLYSPEVAGERTGRLRREIELKEALEGGAVVPYYQPIVDLEDGEIVGAEALARWEHPERGLVAPDEFIPLAEETGLIVDLGRQVTRSACEKLSAWGEEGILPPDFRLHLNLSARELNQSNVAERLDALFREVGLEPGQVAFEVTESVAVERAHVLERIRDLGSPVAVDDFGTEYATLKRLAEIDLDSLKLDRSFVGGIGESSRHEAVLEASLTLAESLELCPVAEGVETGAQRAGLLDRGCRYGQGHLFARAVPAGEFEIWLGERRRLPVE